jgi:hypothetical protein
MRYGMWKVVERLGAYSDCICDCGTRRKVVHYDLKNGKSTNCGCERIKKFHAAAKDANTRHGMTGTSTFYSWIEMRRRCYAKHRKEYKNYGGRGIEVCNEWLDSFEKFFLDMGERPYGHTLDRIDNNGPYSKTNCTWATYKQQGRNTRFNLLVTVNGQDITIAEAAEKSGITQNAALLRLSRGWSVERTFSEPAGRNWRSK